MRTGRISLAALFLSATVLAYPCLAASPREAAHSGRAGQARHSEITSGQSQVVRTDPPSVSSEIKEDLSGVGSANALPVKKSPWWEYDRETQTLGFPSPLILMGGEVKLGTIKLRPVLHRAGTIGAAYFAWKGWPVEMTSALGLALLLPSSDRAAEVVPEKDASDPP